MAPNSILVSEDDIERFQVDGAVCLRNVFDEKWVELVKSGIERNLANPSVYSERLAETGSSSAYFNDYCNWTEIPEFRKYVFESPAGEIAGRLIQSQYSVFYHEHVLVKEAGTSKKTPWHQDQSYYPIDGFKVCSIWMPVDPVSEECTIQFVAGSHRWNRWFYPRKFATHQNYQLKTESSGRNGSSTPGSGSEREYYNVPDIDGSLKEYNILKWAVQPGDCIVFHMRTLHGAPGNSSPVARRILSTRWLGEDAVMASRPWEVSPPIMGGLTPGARVTLSQVFPVIWRRHDSP